MQGLDSIRTAIERSARAVELRPSVGQGTVVTKVRLRDGLSCEVEDGPWFPIESRDLPRRAATLMYRLMADVNRLVSCVPRR